MRLLTFQDDGKLSLTGDLEVSTQPYAILSHTWGKDEEEVNFQDIMDGTGIEKDGYQKLDFCGRQAAVDGLRYFWVDTCCIDKRNSTELQEAINSMFNWYKTAAKCYVYLQDVAINKTIDPDSYYSIPWEGAFRASRWFGRGWTLQELIAPISVQFFSSEGRLLGDKKSLERQIHEITRIPVLALQGRALSEFSVAERMSWINGRTTRKKEDMAYSLFGIFDVQIPLLYAEGQEKAMRRLRQAIDGPSEPTSSEIKSKGKGHFMVPIGRNDCFVGRESILSAVLDSINPSDQPDNCQRTAIEGLGGIGKTSIALEAAYRLRQGNPDFSIFWVPIVDLRMFENAYREIGQLLCIPGIEKDDADVKSLVKAALSYSDTGKWVLIIDNADDPDLVFGDTNGSLHTYLPFSRKGSILFTTRNREVRVRLGVSPRNCIQLAEMSESEGLEMLQKNLEESQLRDTGSTKALLKYLAYLPLAIKQSSVYMERTRISTDRYLDYCRTSDRNEIRLLSQDFGTLDRYQTIANPIATTWLISFKHIERNHPLAVKYLKFICFLAEKDIPASILPGEDEMEKHEAIGVLKGYAFITERGKMDSFDLHRLVKLVTCNWLKSDDEKSIRSVIRHLSDVYPRPKHHNREIWMKYLPHALAALNSHLYSTVDDVSLLDKVARSHYQLGKYQQARQIYQQLLDLRDRILGQEHPDTIMSMKRLANTLRKLGNYREADQMNRQALELREKVLGKEHPETLSSMHNLALTLHRQREYDKAEQMHRQTLELREKILGKEHPDTLSSMNNLARTLHRQGEHNKAQQMHRQTLELREKTLGKEHPDTLNSMNNLALTLHDQGEHNKAQQMHRQTLEHREKILGKEHPDTLNSMNNLARSLHRQGEHNKAQQMHRQTLELREKILGKEHPDTLSSMSNLARTLNEQGEYNKAEKMYQQILELREKVLGKEHPDTLNSMNNLARSLHRQGEHNKAQQMYQQTLELRETILGKEHPETLRSMNNLAITLHEQGEYNKAEHMYRQAFELGEKVLGKEHPDTLNSMNNLALTLHDQGEYNKAEQMYRQAFELREKILGKEHPDTLRSMGNLALTIHEQGEYDQAEQMCRQTLELREKVLGKEHPDTVRSMANLALTFLEQGEYNKAEQMYRQALELYENQSGRHHHDIIHCKGNLAYVLESLGRYDEAERMYQQTHELSKVMLGEEHPSTTSCSDDLSEYMKRREDRELGDLALCLENFHI